MTKPQTSRVLSPFEQEVMARLEALRRKTQPKPLATAIKHARTLARLGRYYNTDPGYNCNPGLIMEQQREHEMWENYREWNREMNERSRQTPSIDVYVH